MIMGIRFPALFTISKVPKRKGLIGVFLYGVAYGLATLSCSGQIFISILFHAATAGGPLNGIIAFVVYALGMGVPIIIATFFVVKAKKIMLRGIVKMMPWVQRISGLVLIVVGIYLIYFYYQSYYVT